MFSHLMMGGGRELSDAGERRRQSMSSGSTVTPVHPVSLTAQTHVHRRDFVEKENMKMHLP